MQQSLINCAFIELLLNNLLGVYREREVFIGQSICFFLRFARVAVQFVSLVLYTFCFAGSASC